LLDPIAQRHRTIAVLKTDQGVIIASGAKQNLTVKQRDALLPNEVSAMRPSGVHAEIKVLRTAELLGWKPRLLAIDGPRPICSDGCIPAIRATGGKPVGPSAASWE